MFITAPDLCLFSSRKSAVLLAVNLLRPVLCFLLLAGADGLPSFETIDITGFFKKFCIAIHTNTSRKINGDLFERLMQLTMKTIGLTIESKTLSISIPESDEHMNYQHDLEIMVNDQIAAIGSVKTSSKDRLNKIFLDKLMYNQLTNTQTPHFSIFLYDVQRAGKEPNYKVGQTFLTGHFKAYTIGLNPLDGVYYCDLRLIMQSDLLLVSF